MRDPADFEAEVRGWIGSLERGATRVSEWSDPLPALTKERREVAVALHTVWLALRASASDASKAGEQWRGLAEAADAVEREVVRRGLPPVRRNSADLEGDS